MRFVGRSWWGAVFFKRPASVICLGIFGHCFFRIRSSCWLFREALPSIGIPHNVGFSGRVVGRLHIGHHIIRWTYFLGCYFLRCSLLRYGGFGVVFVSHSVLRLWFLKVMHFWRIFCHSNLLLISDIYHDGVPCGYFITAPRITSRANGHH